MNIKKTTQKPNEDGLFTIKLPMSKSEVVLKMMTLGDRVSLEQEVRNYPIQSISPVVTSRLNKQIVSLNGDTDKLKIASFIESMPIADSKFIRRFVLDNEPKLDLTREVIAPTGERVMVDITFGVEFFRPFLSV